MSDEERGTYTEYTLTRRSYEDYDNMSDVSHTFRSDDDNLSEILEHMSYFLQGCSFTYVKGLTADKEST